MKKILLSVLCTLISTIAFGQILSYTNATAGTLASVATNATGTTLSRVNGATAPGSPCGTGFSSTNFSSTSTYTTSLGAVSTSLIPNTGYQLNVTGFSVGLRRSSTGPSTVRLAYSLDNGSTWVDKGSNDAPNNAGCGSTTTATWTLGSTVVVTNTTYGIIFRVFCFGATSTSGTFQIQPLTISGTVTASSCSGTPATGTATAGTADLCTSGTSLITLTGAAAGGGISYQWQSSTDSTTWSNITSATNTTYTTPTITSATYYRCKTTCSNSSTTVNSNGAKVTVTAITSNPTNDTVSEGSSTSYSVVAIGAASYQWQRSTTGTGGTFVNITSATLDTTGVYSGYNTNTLTLSSVPAAWGGRYAYRCVVTNTCGNITSTGATLTVNPVTCSGAPSAGSASASTTSFCTSGSTTVLLTGYSVGTGITYQWQTSPDSSTWTDVTGATSTAFATPSLTTTTYYHCVVTCTYTSTTSTSTGVKIALAQLPVLSGVSGPSSVCIGATITLSDTATSGTWSSVTPAVATISTGGVLTGVAVGTDTVKYSKTNVCGTTVARLLVTVNQTPAAVTVTPTSVSLCPAGPATALVASGGGLPYTVSNSASPSINLGAGSATGAGSLTISGVPAGATVTGITVTVNMTSNFLNDYGANIKAPNGNILNLFSSDGPHGSGSYTNTVISSTGTTALSSGSSPFTGTFKADLISGYGYTGYIANTTLWSDLYSTPNGTWTIAGKNNTTFSNTCTLTSFTVNISYTYPASITWSPTTGLFATADTSVAYTGSAATTVYARPYTTTTYTATATNGGCTSSANAAVNVSSTLYVAGITGAGSLCVNDTTTLADSTLGGRWSSLNSYARVDSITGKVTADTAGTAVIAYLYTSGSCSNYVTRNITINPLPVVGAITGIGTGALCTGSTMALSDTTSTGTWISSSTAVATINSSGLVTPVAQGSAIITFTHTDGTCTNRATATVNVYNTPNAMAFSPTSVSMCSGSAARLLTATGGVSGGSPVFTNSGSYSFINGIPASSPIVVSGIPSGATVTSINVRFSGTSSYSADEQFNLEAPNGNSINLMNGLGGSSAAGFTNVVFNPAASSNVSSGSNPYTGTWLPQGGTGVGVSGHTSNVSTLAGLYSTPNGTWNLVGIHTYSTGTGVISNWTLTITYTVPSSITWSPATGLYTNSAGTASYSGTATPTVYAAPGATSIYTVTSTNGGCTSVGNDTVTVLPLPTAAISASTAICATGSTIVTFTGDNNDSVFYNVNGGATQRIKLSAIGSATVTATPASTSVYSLTSVKSPSGCVTTYSSLLDTITVIPLPSISIGANPSVCQPVSSATISYTTAAGGPTAYSIAWSAAALADSFSNLTGATLSGGLMTIPIPNNHVTGTYTGSITVSSGICAGAATYPFSVTISTYPSAYIATVPAAICSGSAASIVINGTSGANIYYSVDSGTALSAVLSGGTYVLATGTISTPHSYQLLTVNNPVCSTVIDSSITISPIPMAWVGGTSSDWNDSTNWSCGYIPGVNDNVGIPAGTAHSPSIAASGFGTVKGLNIASGATLSIGSGGVLNVNGDITNNSAIVGAGALSLNSSTPQRIGGIGSYRNLDVNNNAGVKVNIGAQVIVTGALSISAGNLTTNDSVILYSDSLGTARVASLPTSGSSITGNITQQQYIGWGRRAYRFWAHPFSNWIPLSVLGQYIDVTGTGGSANGFTTTGSNAPSAYRYNTYYGNSSAASDPGWEPFTSAYGTVDSNRLHQYQGIRIFYRGAKGQGLGYGPYTDISATTLQMRGLVNQGAQNVPMAKGTGAHQDYNMIGNPYPSPVDIGTVVYNAYAAGRITGVAFYVWNPYLGTAGQFQAITYGTTSALPYYIQANNCFQVRAAHDGDMLNFNESNKSATFNTTLLRESAEYTTLVVYDGSHHPYDMLNIQFNDAATDNEDARYDAVKPVSAAEFNFYSISSDQQKMAIDARPYKQGSVIPLGLSSAYAQDFVIRAEHVSIPEGSQMYLHDKFLKSYTLLNEGSEYQFSANEAAGSQGENRFELTMATAETVAATCHIFNVSMTPNPANNEVNIHFNCGTTQQVTVRILDMIGTCVFNKDMGKQSQGQVTLPLNEFASGVYMVEVSAGNEKSVQKLIKE